MPSRAHAAAFASAVALFVSCLVLVSPARALPPEWVDAWRADLAFAADSLPKVHPNFFARMSREEWRAELDSLSARLPSLEPHEAVVDLARIVVRVGDGHTRVTMPFARNAGFFTGHATTATPKMPGLVFRTFPVRFGLFGDSLWVMRTDAAHRELLGGRVVRLGRRTAGEAIHAVEPVVQRDNENSLRNLLPSWLVTAEILAARGVIEHRDALEIEVEDTRGRRRTGQFAPADTGAVVAWIEARPAGQAPPLAEREPDRFHWFTTLPERDAVYARIHEVQDQGARTFAGFADSLVATFEASGARRLVLDLRGNPGGNGELRRPLIRALLRSRATTEPGVLWALLDRGTFSAAVMLAADLETWTPAILAGELTGGDPNAPGDSRRVVLPRTGLTVRVSSLYWQVTDPRDRRDGVSPHVPVATSFADWRDGKDPVLEAALAMAGGSRFSSHARWAGSVGVDYGRYPFTLALSGEAGTLDVPAFGAGALALERAAWSGEALRASFTTGGTRWQLDAVPAGGAPPRLVGILAGNGRLFPVVLEAVATAETDRPAGTGAR